MWKKSEPEQPEVASSFTNVRSQPIREQAIIGASLMVKGDVTGDEDLLIQGQVEGRVVLKNNAITVGKNGNVKADLYGKLISVEGVVQGNLFADEKIIVKQTGTVRGNLQAPRVTLEDGAKFKGSIEMEGGGLEKGVSGAGTETLSGSGEKDRKSLVQGELGIKPPSPARQ